MCCVVDNYATHREDAVGVTSQMMLNYRLLERVLSGVPKTAIPFGETSELPT